MSHPFKSMHRRRAIVVVGLRFVFVGTLLAFNARSESRVRRNGVGISSPQDVVFAISEDPVNFYEFATLFRDGLHCPDALYLDGAISSLHATALGRDDSRADLGPIIAVTE